MMMKYKYIVFSLVVAVLFVVGSMAAMNYLLRYREAKLLTGRGKLEVESPVREWNGRRSDEKNIASGDDEGIEYPLTMEQMEEAVKSWSKRTEVTLHDRVTGQISMEKAIENGKMWLKEMKIDKEADETSFSINAELGIGRQKKDMGGQREAYFSFWTVTYLNQSMNAVLYLNAVTGKVWGAEIKLYKEPSKKIPDTSLQTFVSLTGLQVPDGDIDVTGTGEVISEIAIKGSRLYVQESAYSMSIVYEKGYDWISYQLLSK